MASLVDYKQKIDLRYAVTTDVPHGRTPVKVSCIAHDDKIESMAVYPDGVHCYACGYNVGPLDFLARLNGLDAKADFAAVAAIADAMIEQGEAPTPTKTTPDTKTLAASVDEYQKALFHATGLYKLRYLQDDRHLTEDTIRTACLGYTGRAYVIPQFDRDGELFSMKYRRDDADDANGPKYWTHAGYGTTALVYPKPFARWGTYRGVVVLAEGEFDALLLSQMGVPALTVNNGVNSIGAVLPDLAHYAGVLLCLDMDKAGLKVAQDVAKELDAMGLPARSAHWNGAKCGNDVTEVVSNGYGDRLIEQLRQGCQTVRALAAKGRATQ